LSDPYLGEIRILPYTFSPSGWAFCNGQLLPISQNTALFSLLGTNYGGDGRTTFALPDLQGSAAMMWGQGPGLSLHDLGEAGGGEAVTLNQAEMATHPAGGAGQPHALLISTVLGNAKQPPGQMLAPTVVVGPYGPNTGTTTTTAPLGIAGGSQPHNNMQPYLVVNFCIALQGIFPPRG
jgi:microcystin-dependent protein